VVTRAVFGRGHVSYHRIVGAVLVYLLIQSDLLRIHVLGLIYRRSIQGDRVRG